MTNKSRSEMVNSPPHYTTEDGIECIDAMVARWGKQRVKEYAEIASFKYSWRMGKKGDPAEDKLKAIWYLRFSMGDDPRKDITSAFFDEQ